MQSFLLALGIVAPLFIWMAIGYAARLTLKLKDDWVRQTNNVMFKIFFCALLIKSMVQSDISTLSGHMINLVVYVLIAVCIMLLAALIIVPRLERANSRRSVIIQGVLRSNTALFGLPVAISIYGDSDIAPITLMLVIIVPLYNIMAVLLFEYYRGSKPKALDMLKSIAKNPLIMGIAAGLFINFTKITLPAPVQSALWGMADCATPISFFLLGASFTFTSAQSNVKPISAVAAAKLVLAPLIIVGAAILLGFRNQQLLAVLMVFGPPTAVSSYPMAVALGGDGVLASEIVVFTSIFAVFTIFLWLFGLNFFGLL